MSCPVYLGCCCDVSQGPVGGTGVSGFPGLRVSISFVVLPVVLMCYILILIFASLSGCTVLHNVCDECEFF